MTSCHVISVGSLWFVVASAGAADVERAETRSGGVSAVVDFNRDVRPILSDRCFPCHGPDGESRAAGLRLDLEVGLFGEAESGITPVVAGDLEGSEAYQRVTSLDAEYRMPPEEAGPPLTAEQIRTIRAWISSGAPFGDHWAFVKPVRGRHPSVSNRAWPRNPIDYFVLSRMEEAGLVPASEADRRTLIRRLSFDLRGLPPTPDEVQEFVSDSRNDAYERLVDRFLASPSYGERQAQDWLDQARYADTTGYAADMKRPTWLYRDWVIRALNDGMPFDQFTIEQLAGDMLPDSTVQQVIATGFHRQSPQALGNNPRKEEFRVKGIVDRVNTTGRVWLGLSLECAQCHDHKFDPISQREYFGIYALFNNIPHHGEAFGVHGPRISVLPSEVESQRREWQEQVARLSSELLTRDAALIKRQREWEADPDAFQFTEHALPGLVGRWAAESQPDDEEQRQLPDRGDSAIRLPPWVDDDPHRSGRRAWQLSRKQFVRADRSETVNVTGDMTIAAWVKTKDTVGDIVSKYDWRDGQRSYALVIGGEGEPGYSPGRLAAWFSASTGVFDGVEIESSYVINDGQWHHVAVVFRAGESVSLIIDGVVDQQAEARGTVPKQIAVCERDLLIGAGYRGGQEQTAFHYEGLLHDVRIYRGAVDNIGVLSVIPGDVRDSLALPRDERTNEQSRQLDEFYESIDPVRLQTRFRIADLKRRISELEQLGEVAQVMQEMETPRETFVHERGNYKTPGERVTPGVPARFAATDDEGPRNRLEFARWLVSGEHPLTARVTVNRIWQHSFGNGIVRTDSDFGYQGEWPSHPDLLDWLACEFVESGWNVKSLHRRIVTSATYRQSSRVTPQLLVVDPENRLLARGPRFRLAAEQIRDNMLAVSGLLDRRIGGPSVYPVQPEGLWEEHGQNTYSGKWTTSRGPDLYRRGMYTFWKRMMLYPSLRVFDAPMREVCVTRRPITNTPLAALVGLNDPVFTEAAAGFADRILSGAESTRSTDRITLAFELCLSRPPDAEELQMFEQFLRVQWRRFRDDPDAAQRLTAVTPSDQREADVAELAAWTLVASTLLNLDETLTLE